MIKILLIAIAVIVVLVVVVFLYGMSIPKTQSLTVTKTIAAPADQVWAVMTDWEAQPEWRDDLKKVEVISPDEFIEHPKHAGPITFRVVEQDRPRLLKLDLSGPFTANYIVELTESDGVAVVTESYSVTQPSAIGRVMASLFFDLEKFANDYLNRLEQRTLSQGD